MPETLLLDEFLPYRLSFTANLVSELIARSYKSLFGITIPEWRVVVHVAAGAGVTQQEICRLTRMDKVTVSRAALALTARGLIARDDHPADRRSHRLRLSPAGEGLYAQIAPKALELERALFDGFAPEEITALVAMLRRIDARTLAAIAGEDAQA